MNSAAFLRAVNKVMDALGFMGLAMRSRPVDAEKSTEDREWGEAVAGFSLSIEPRPKQSAAPTPVKLAIALRNASGKEIRQKIPGWVRYFDLRIVGPGGALLEPTPYGERLRNARPEVSLDAMFPVQAPLLIELPLSELYNLSASGTYRLTASCQVPQAVPGTSCASNREEFVRG